MSGKRNSPAPAPAAATFGPTEVGANPNTVELPPVRHRPELSGTGLARQVFTTELGSAFELGDCFIAMADNISYSFDDLGLDATGPEAGLDNLLVRIEEIARELGGDTASVTAHRELNEETDETELQVEVRLSGMGVDEAVRRFDAVMHRFAHEFTAEERNRLVLIPALDADSAS